MKRNTFTRMTGTTSLRMMGMVLTFLMLFACSKREDCHDPKKNNDGTSRAYTMAQMAEMKVAQDKLVAYIKTHREHPVQKIGDQETRSSGTKRNSENSEALKSVFSNADVDYNRFLINRAINPDDYQCGPTIIDDYINMSVVNWTDDDFMVWFYFGNVPFDYAYVFANKDGGQYYGPSGEFTNAANRTFKDLLRFWDIPTDIIMRDAHGTLYKDVDKVVSVLLLYGYDEADANYIAELLKIIFGSPDFMQYNHPLITFNAFAAPADPYFGTVKKIVMGDGIMKAYGDLGFGDISTQAILAHEFGHHVQFANNVDFGNSPEATRRTELMADAFAAYFLTNKRGAAANWKRVQEFLQVFYSIGDCAFDNNGHHGTPNQRMKSATWGYNLANDAQKQGKIMKSAEFITLFDAALPAIIAPDTH